MKENFYSRCVYIGYDLKEFNRIRDILDENRVRYKYRVNNRLGRLSPDGAGTARGRMGSAGIPADQMYEYQIRVKDSDYIRTQHIICSR